MIRFLLLLSLTTILKDNSNSFATTTTATYNNIMSIKAMDFEIFGRVQGVFFRKYTKEQAEKLDLRGWCKNTDQGTVQGHMEGPAEKVETMVHWLKNTGSPSSKIEKAEFKNQKDLTDYTCDSFRIIKE